MSKILPWLALGMLVFFATVSVPTASAGPTDYCYTNAQGQHVCCTVPTCNRICTDNVYPWWDCYLAPFAVSL